MRRIRQITADRSIPLIADEVQTGVGRTGAFWAVEHSGVTPDVMVLSKAIGGSLPLAVVVYRDDLDVWQPGAHAGTFRGNQLAMAAGTATLAYVRENRLAERADAVGSRMLDQLRALSEEFGCIGDVRGRGLMIGVEVVEPEADTPVHRDAGSTSSSAEGPDRGSAGRGVDVTATQNPEGTPRPAAPELAAAIQRECLRRGLIVELGGRHSSVVRLLPPLTISDEQAAAVLDRLADAVAAVSHGHTERDREHEPRPRRRRRPQSDQTDRTDRADRADRTDRAGRHGDQSP
jgi:diaminobutyrate-2-oxoglutarate transaminase